MRKKGAIDKTVENSMHRIRKRRNRVMHNPVGEAVSEEEVLKIKSEMEVLLIKKYKREFTPIEVRKELKVTNKTVINRLAILAKNGFVIPMMVNQRISSYELSDYTKNHEKEIVKAIK